MKHLVKLACLLIVFPTLLYGENILIISIDTLRADRLSCYGYQKNETTHIDKWAVEGVRFEKAYSEFPLTLPAHSTIFTATYPFYHGVRENVGFLLTEDQVTLAEILRKNGYLTGAFIGSYVLASEFGTSQGFDAFDEEFPVPIESVISASALQRPAEQVTDSFLKWLERNPESKFFAFVHFYDPHTPRPNGYDWEVSRVDRSIGRIDAYLRKSNLLEKTHIFLLSDHGESLGEHGESGHGFFIYDSTLRVPLIVRPAQTFSISQKLVKQVVSLVDVMPTVLQMVGLRGPSHLQGRSMIPMMLGKEARDIGLYAESYIPQLHFGWSPLRSFRLGRYKFIDAPRPELYDVVEDCGEKMNLFSERPVLAKQYREQLEEFVSKYQPRDGAHAAAGLGRATSEKLAALGYVKLSPKIRSDFGKGVDPKERIAVFESYHGVVNDLAERKVTRRIFARIEEIRRQAPEIRGLVTLEARAHQRLGNLEEAHKRYRQALEEDPDNNLARAYMATVMIHLGKMDEAERELHVVLANDPDDYRSRNNLAGLYRMKGKVEAAITEMKKIVETRSTYAAGWHNLGQLYAQTRKWEAAEAALHKAVNLDQRNALAHLHLAYVLNAVGKTDEAKRERHIALELDPGLSKR
ncbi:sulfatase-like hydrolase/transferase [Acidobacteria bacterium AH-259-O06]|nr:sulfatase-like hydrolase/transferase [Acidobacteria bacterium AH-259-O06]